MKEILLCKYGELILKGANRKFFEDSLCRELRHRAKTYGNFDVYRSQSTIYITPMDEDADLEGMFSTAKKVFGIVAVHRCAVAEKAIEDISRVAREYLQGGMQALGQVLPHGLDGDCRRDRWRDLGDHAPFAR